MSGGSGIEYYFTTWLFSNSEQGVIYLSFSIDTAPQ